MSKRSELATPTPRSGGAASPERATVSRAAVETRVFRSGNSDAVRIPKGFGLSGKTVKLRRMAGDRVLIEPKTKRRWPAGFLSSFGQATALAADAMVVTANVREFGRVPGLATENWRAMPN